jgi:hypothetical protein
MALLDAIQGHLGQSQIGQISQQLGIDPAMAQTAIAAAVPMIMAGMAKHASNPEGATAIQQAAETHQDVTDNVGAVLQAGPPADTTGLLGRILGHHNDTVQQGVQQASGLDSEKARKLLMMLSPIVLSVLARKQFGNQQQTSPTQISDTLQQEAQTAQQQVQRNQPHLGGLLGQIFGARS